MKRIARGIVWWIDHWKQVKEVLTGKLVLALFVVSGFAHWWLPFQNHLAESEKARLSHLASATCVSKWLRRRLECVFVGARENRSEKTENVREGVR